VKSRSIPSPEKGLIDSTTKKKRRIRRIPGAGRRKKMVHDFLIKGGICRDGGSTCRDHGGKGIVSGEFTFTGREALPGSF